MKSIILILTTILVFSCGQDDKLVTETTKQTTIPEASDQRDIDTAPSSTSNPIHSGSTTALTFINAYVDNCNKMRDAIGISEWINSSALLTKNFKDELKRILNESYEKDPELGLGSDPVFDAQDFPDKGFVLESVDGDYVTVCGKDWADFKLRIKVEKEAEEWLVDGSGIINIPVDKRIVR